MDEPADAQHRPPSDEAAGTHPSGGDVTDSPPGESTAAAEGSAAEGSAAGGDPNQPPPGPGCMPAVVAITLLTGMVFFIAFGFSAWLIFQKRGDLAVRTLRGTIIPHLQQSRLEPEEKRAAINELSGLADDMERGMYENWQSGGIMQRLITSPLMRWGDLQSIQRWAATNLPEQQRQEAQRQISRFFRAAELDRVVARDVHDVLAPVSSKEDATGFVQLRSDFSQQDVLEVVQRAKLVADRAEVPDQNFPPVSLPQFIRRQIEQGSRSGAA